MDMTYVWYVIVPMPTRWLQTQVPVYLDRLSYASVPCLEIAYRASYEAVAAAETVILRW